MSYKLLLTASVVALFWGGVARAQSTTPIPKAQPATPVEPIADAKNTRLTEVVVTGERRSTNLQTSAIAATVLTGATLEKRGVTTVDQLQFVAPSVTVNDYGIENDFVIRGIGKAAENANTIPGVVIYRDGVATFPSLFQDEPYYDIAALELLRGPQGTFAGQNATGGAVFITETNPNLNGLHGYAQAEYGNYNHGQIQGAVNIPIGDTLAIRLATDEQYHDSFYKITGPYTGDPGRLQSTSDRFSLLWTPVHGLKVLFKVDYNYIDNGGVPAGPYDPTDPNGNLFHLTSNSEALAIDQWVRSVLDVSYQFASGITLRSISGYQTGREAIKQDVDGTDAGNQTFASAVDETIYSEELNLISSNKGPLTWVTGLYYSSNLLGLPAGAYRYAFPPEVITLHGHEPSTIKAIFGQLSYKLPAGFELQAGARYSNFQTSENIVEAVPLVHLVLPAQQKESDSKVTGKVTLNWTVNPRNFLYAFVATGHKGGGLNLPTSLTLPATFKPEDVTDYELGWKSRLFDGLLTTQIGGYYNTYKEFQVYVGNPGNAANQLEVNDPNTSTLYGIEAEGQLHSGPASLTFGASYEHTRLGTLYAVDTRLPHPGTTTCDLLSGPATSGCLELVGKQQPYAPEFTFNMSGQYVFDLPNGDSVTPSLTFGHVDTQSTTIFQNEALGDKLGVRNLLGAQIPYQHGPWVITAYGTNLTNQTYAAGAGNSGLRYAGAPRQYGVRFTRKF